MASGNRKKRGRTGNGRDPFAFRPQSKKRPKVIQGRAMPGFVHCSETGKRGYKTRHDAELWLAIAILEARQESRVYECEFCGRWHLTSKPRKVKEPYDSDQPDERRTEGHAADARDPGEAA